MITLILFSFFVVLLSAFYSWDRFSKRKLIAIIDKIPGPIALPIVGNGIQFLKSRKGLFSYFTGDLLKYGRVIRVWIWNEPQIIVKTASDFEKLLKGNANMEKSRSYRYLEDWIGLALMNAKGERFFTYKKIMVPTFHVDMLHEFIPIFTKNAMILNNKLSLNKKRGGFDIFPYMSVCGLDIICESSMGAKINAQKDNKAPYVQSILGILNLLVHRYTSPLLRFDFFYNWSLTKWKMDRHIKLINQFSYKVIDERRQYLKSMKSAEKGSKRRRMVFLDLLLTAEDQHPDILTQKDICDNVSSFIFAGYDTTTTSMCWTLFLFGIYPQIQERVVEELESVFGESGRTPSLEDLNQLKYLERCIKESLRLYPSGYFIERTLSEDTQLDDYLIPAGCDVMFNIFALHRDPKYFPDPEKFDPDRFLPENCVDRSPYAYVPFSVGVRNCIGQKYAILEEKAVLSTILRKFRVEAAHAREEAQFEAALILKPANGLHIRVFERESHPKLKINEQD